MPTPFDLFLEPFDSDENESSSSSSSSDLSYSTKDARLMDIARVWVCANWNDRMYQRTFSAAEAVGSWLGWMAAMHRAVVAEVGMGINLFPSEAEDVLLGGDEMYPEDMLEMDLSLAARRAEKRRIPYFPPEAPAPTPHSNSIKRVDNGRAPPKKRGRPRKAPPSSQ